MTRDRLIVLVIVLALVLLGLSLRLYCLDAQSYWSDEGASVTLALGPLEDIAPKSAADIHPPLYYYLLWFWVHLFGPSELAVRSLSVLAGTLLVALTFAIGRRTVGTGAALIGTFLCAISPLLIYYSQEARMYELMALWGALSAWFLLQLTTGKAQTPKPKAQIWVGYVVVATLGLYTQYFFFTVLLWQNLYILYHASRITFHAARNTQHAARNTLPALRFTLPWIAAQAAVGVLFLPWALRAGGQLAGWPSFGEPFTLPDLLRRVFVAFTFGPAAAETLTGKAAWALWALVALSLIALLWTIAREWLRPKSEIRNPKSQTTDVTFIALYLFVPIAAVYVLSQNRPMDKPDFVKQILAAAPAYCLFLGLGIAGSGRLVNWGIGRLRIGKLGFGAWGLGFACLVLAGLTFFSGRALNAYYHNPKYARDDYRGLAALIAASEQPGDAIILNAPGQIEIFELYYHGPATRYPLPRQRPIDEGVTAADLEALAAEHGRVWLVLWAVEESDPGRFVEGWLDAHAYKTLEQWYGNVRLVLYQVAASGAASIERPLRLRLGEAITLLGYNLPPMARAGEVAPLTLFWQASQPVERRYKVFAHVINGHDYLWGQRDAEPVGNARPTTTWVAGEAITDAYGLLVLPGTPPGEYHVEVGMYGLAPPDGARLLVYDAAGAPQGDRVLLGPITVTRPLTPPPTEALLIPHPLEHEFGDDIRLLGYSLTRWGETEERTEFASGEVALLTLFWRAAGQPGDNYCVRVQLLDSAGQAVLTREVAPAEGHAPTASWQPGDAVRDQHRLALAGVASGTYRLAVALVAEDGRALGGGPVEVGPITVR